MNIWRATILLLGLAAATAGHAEVAPQVMSGSGGVLSINTYSAAYLPATARVGAMQAGLDGRLTTRWSVFVRTTSSVNETFSGAAGGVTYNLRQYRLVSTDGPDGLAQVRTTVVPVWNARIGLGVGRWSYSQVLLLNDPTRAARLREVPVKAAVYGVQLRAAVSRTFGPTWSVDGEYSLIYALAGGFSIIGHTVTAGPSYWF